MKEDYFFLAYSGNFYYTVQMRLCVPFNLSPILDTNKICLNFLECRRNSGKKTFENIRLQMF